jgi:predicted metal-dependent hydrolase
MRLEADWTPLKNGVSRDLFNAEIAAWAKRISLEASEVHIRPMTRKWGSCSTTGRLSSNTELLTAPAKVRKRVIVEELLHLKLPNHGKLFKALLKAYLKD